MKSDPGRYGGAYARYSSLVFQMIIIILAGVFGGDKLDELIDLHFPLFTLILTLIATALSMYLLIKEILKENNKKGK